MKFTTVFAAAFLAASASAAPTLDGLPKWISKAVSQSTSRSCDISNLQQPSPAGTPLPSPKGKLVTIALGKGTQNYTCPSTPSASAVPTAVGAIATLYDGSCIAKFTDATAMDYMIDAVNKLPADSALLNALPTIGHHYFNAAGAPTFDLTPVGLGVNPFKKNAQSPAPTSAKNAVPWLYLTAATDSQKAIEVYRLQTHDGAAPATCGDKTGAFQVQYSAEYWFYEAK